MSGPAFDEPTCPKCHTRMWGDKCYSGPCIVRQQGLFSPRSAARNGERIWEIHGGRYSTDSDSAYHNPNAVYERAQAQHTIDRSKE